MDDNFVKCTKCGNKAVRLFFSVACDYCDGLVKQGPLFLPGKILLGNRGRIEDAIHNSKNLKWTEHEFYVFSGVTADLTPLNPEEEIGCYYSSLVDYSRYEVNVGGKPSFFGRLMYDFQTFVLSANEHPMFDREKIGTKEYDAEAIRLGEVIFCNDPTKQMKEFYL